MVNFLSTQVDVEFTLSSSEIRRNDQIRSIAMVTLASLELRGSWAHNLQCVRRGEALLAVIQRSGDIMVTMRRGGVELRMGSHWVDM